MLNPYYCVKMNDLIHKCNVINTLRICSLTWKSSSLSFFFNKSSLRLSPTLYNYATRLSQNEHKISVRNIVWLLRWKLPNNTFTWHCFYISNPTNMGYWPSTRSKWLDICQEWGQFQHCYIPVHYIAFSWI